MTNRSNSTVDDSVSTYAGSLGLKFGMGPVMLTAEGQYGQNWGNTGCLYRVATPLPQIQVSRCYQPTAASNSRAG